MWRGHVFRFADLYVAILRWAFCSSGTLVYHPSNFDIVKNSNPWYSVVAEVEYAEIYIIQIENLRS